MRLPNLAAGTTYRDNPPPGYAGLAPATGVGPNFEACSGNACIPGVSNCGSGCRCLCSILYTYEPFSGAVQISDFVGCKCQL
jgi:hypothetical protein